MRAFRNGEREFRQDEVVYVIDNQKLESVLDISFGKIDSYRGGGEYYVDLYTVTDNRDVLNRNLKFNITDDNVIKEFIDKGYIVPKSTLQYYTKYHRELPQYVITNKSNIFKSGKEALEEFQKRKQKREAEIQRLKGMTEYERCKEEDYNYLKRRNLSEEEIEKCFNIIDTNENLPCLEDILIRCFGKKVEWKNGTKWDTLMVLDRPEEIPEVHDEKYYVSVHHIWDADETPVFQGYTNESPESIFQKYGDFKEYVMHIANKEWSIDKGLTVPCGYKNEATLDENGELKPILVTMYGTEHGTFEIANGKLRFFDMSINYKHSVCTFWISIIGKTKMNDQEIREWFSKRIGKVTGQFEELFKEQINELEIRIW